MLRLFFCLMLVCGSAVADTWSMVTTDYIRHYRVRLEPRGLLDISCDINHRIMLTGVLVDRGIATTAINITIDNRKYDNWFNTETNAGTATGFSMFWESFRGATRIKIHAPTGEYDVPTAGLVRVLPPYNTNDDTFICRPVDVIGNLLR